MKLRTDFLLLLLGRLLLALSGAIAVKVYTSILTVSEVGALVYFLTICQFCSMFSIYPAGSYYQRFIITRQKAGLMISHIKQYTTSLVAGFGISFCIVVALSSLAILNLSWSWEAVVLLMFVYLVMVPIRDSMIVSLNLLGYRRLYAIFGVLSAYLAILLAWWLCLKTPSAYIWLVAVLPGALILTVPATMIVVARPPLCHDSNLTEVGFIKFCLPLVLTALGTWMLSDSNRIVLEHMGGKEGLAFVVVALNLGSSIILIVERLFADFYSPGLFRSTSGGVEAVLVFWPKYFQRLVFTCLWTTLLVAVGAPILAKFLVGPRFQGIQYWIILGALFRVALTMISSCFVFTQLMDRPRVLWYHAFIGALISNLVLVPLYFYGGFPGALLAINIGVWVTAGWVLLTIKKQFEGLRFGDIRPPLTVRLWVVALFGFGVVLTNYAFGLTGLCLGAALAAVIWVAWARKRVWTEVDAVYQWLQEIHV